MDLTPKFAKMDFSEDSGCVTSSSMEISPDESSTSLPQQNKLYTPHTNVTSRKRKLSHTTVRPVAKFSNETPVFDSPKASPWYNDQWGSHILSSTLNESQAKDLDNYIIENITPNYYTERQELSSLNLSADCKSKSAPATPPRCNERLCITDDFNISHSRTSSTSKLGSPEYNAILHPELKYFEPPFKPRTPQKFAESIKRYTPAKKRLFGVAKPAKLDPISFFENDEKKFKNIIEKIISYLSDTDLYNFKLVSAKWRRVLSSCKNASDRLDAYMDYCKLNKENYSRRRSFFMESRTPGSPVKAPLSPKSKKYQVFIDLGKLLKPGQSLQKCPRCDYASIVDQNIIQCQRDLCGYIFCSSCSSFSTTGPENFIDKCQQSKLVVEKPRNRSSLWDSPMKESTEEEIPSFFLSNSLNSSLSKYDSGYVADQDLSVPKVLSSLPKEKTSILHDCNRDLVSMKKNTEKRSSLASVVPITSKKEEIMEPSSPPKIIHVAFSKQSKKNLKRLLR